MFDNNLFIEQLIIKAMPDLDNDGLDLLKEDVKPIVFDRVMTNIAAKMNDAQAEEFMQLVEKKASEKDILEYLNKIIPNYETFIENIYDEFEIMYLKECKAQDNKDEE